MTMSPLIPIALSDDEEPTELTCNYRAALAWLRRGFNVVPRAGVDHKHPAIKWREFQDCYVTTDDLLNWYDKFSGGLGLVTGAISCVIVIESDGLAGEKVLRDFEHHYGPLPATLIIRSGSGRGLHRYFRHPSHTVKTTANKLVKLDIRGDGGFCVLPPSRHKSGGYYEIVHDVDPAELPKGLLEFIAEAEVEALNQLSKEGISVAVAPSLLIDSELGNNLSTVVQPPPAEKMRAALKHLAAQNAFEHRNEIVKDRDGKITRLGWIITGMALKSAYGNKVGFDLWAETHDDHQARVDAPTQWASFREIAKAGDVTIATIIRAATDAGFGFKTDAISSPPTAVTKTEDSTGDVRNGLIFARMFRNRLLYVYETKDWLKFDKQQGWVKAPPDEDVRAAKEVLTVMRAHVADQYKIAPDEEKTKKLMKNVERTSFARNLLAMIEMAKSEPGMTVRLEEFDADPMLLGLTNGILDLKNGVLMPASPDVLVSKRARIAYDPDAKCPRFLKFLAEVQPESDVRDYLCRLAGYSLTGRTTEQQFNFFHGSGANGKTVFVELIRWLLGDYSKKISTEMLMQHKRNPQGASPDIVGLKGIRFAYCSETEIGQRLSASLIKELTGSETLSGRPLYGATVNFQPTHKLTIVGNHKPEISDNSDGMWRRVNLVPFEVTVLEAARDIDLESKLRGEGPGILNWALEGLHEWLDHGLQVPERITAATSVYRDEMDVVGEWITECCNVGDGHSARKDVIYASYQEWTKVNGHSPLAQTRLTRRLGERGYKIAPDHRKILGIALKPTMLGSR